MDQEDSCQNDQWASLSDQWSSQEEELLQLFERTAPKGNPVQVDVLLSDRVVPVRRPQSNSWRLSPTVHSYRVASAIALFAAIALPCFMLLLSSSSSVAFADIKRQIAAARSVQYIEFPKKGRFDRKSMRPHARSVRFNVKTGRSRVMILGRYRLRRQHEDGDGNVVRIEIVDSSTGKWLSIDPRARRCTEIERQIVLNSKGERHEEPVRPDLSVDFYATVLAIPDDAKQLADERTIDGVRAIGFRSERTTIWVNPTTRLPIRVETKDWVMSEFRFDLAFDASLFSTTPPDGYSVAKSTVISYHLDNE